MESIPEAGGAGSGGCSTDSCLKAAYLSEVEEDEDPDTGVSMEGALGEREREKYGNMTTRVILCVPLFPLFL